MGRSGNASRTVAVSPDDDTQAIAVICQNRRVMVEPYFVLNIVIAKLSDIGSVRCEELPHKVVRHSAAPVAIPATRISCHEFWDVVEPSFNGGEHQVDGRVVAHWRRGRKRRR